MKDNLKEKNKGFIQTIMVFFGHVGSIITIIFSLLLLSYGLFSIWDMVQVYSGAYVNDDILKYKPLDDGDGGPNPSIYKLMDINEDVIAWLSIEGTGIDYPVLQGKSDMEYINKDINGETSVSGSIFLSSSNDNKIMDDYSIIYGHHLDNSTMFGDVTNFMNKEYFDAHPKGVLFLPEKTYSISIFACVKNEAYDKELYDIGNKNENQRTKLLNYIKSIAICYRNVVDDGKSKILALSTCNNYGLYGRTMIFGYLKEVGIKYDEDGNKIESNSTPNKALYPDNYYTVRFGIKRYGFSIINLICLFVSAVIVVANIYIYKREKRNSINTDRKVTGIFINTFISIIIYIAMLIVYFITQDIKVKIVIIDRWTVVFIGILLILAVLKLIQKSKLQEENEGKNSLVT